MPVLEQIEAHYASGDYQGLIKRIESYEPAESEVDRILEIKGRSLQKLERYEEALGAWNLLLSRDSSNAYFYGERGVCKFHLRYKSALDDLDRAVELEPDDAYHLACRAYIKDKLGDTEGSVEDYRRSVELDPENEVTQNNLGLAEEKLGYTQRARERFKKIR